MSAAPTAEPFTPCRCQLQAMLDPDWQGYPCACMGPLLIGSDGMLVLAAVRREDAPPHRFLSITRDRDP